MISFLHKPSTFELIIQLLEVLIWPLTLLFILVLFRKFFGETFKRLGTLKADRTGITLSFNQLLENTKNTFQQLNPAAVAKSSVSIDSRQQGTPFEQLNELKSTLEGTVRDLASEAQIDPVPQDPIACVTALQKVNMLTSQKSQLITALLETLQAAPATITQKQVDDMMQLYRSL